MPPVVLAATANLVALQPLPLLATPSFVPDGKGGGTIGITVPRGLEETLLFVQALGGSGSGACVLSHESSQYYTIVTHASGKLKLLLADDLGQSYSGAATPSICPQETYAVYAAGFDYPAYEAAYPQNLSVTPRISGANGQADVTTSAAFSGQYPL